MCELVLPRNYRCITLKPHTIGHMCLGNPQLQLHSLSSSTASSSSNPLSPSVSVASSLLSSPTSPVFSQGTVYACDRCVYSYSRKYIQPVLYLNIVSRIMWSLNSLNLQTIFVFNTIFRSRLRTTSC